MLARSKGHMQVKCCAVHNGLLLTWGSPQSRWSGSSAPHTAWHRCSTAAHPHWPTPPSCLPARQRAKHKQNTMEQWMQSVSDSRWPQTMCRGSLSLSCAGCTLGHHHLRQACSTTLTAWRHDNHRLSNSKAKPLHTSARAAISHMLPHRAGSNSYAVRGRCCSPEKVQPSA